jgi:AcrR family transcriptional regulator
MGKLKEIHNNTKERILEIAGRFFVKHSYRGVSLGMIAERVGIRKASLYYYFKNKEDLYFGSLEKILDELSIEIDEIVKQKISSKAKAKKLVIAFIDFSVKKEKFIRAIIQNFPFKKKQLKRFCNIGKKRDAIIEKIEPIVEDCLGKKAKGVDLRMFVYILIGGINIVMEEHIYNDKKEEINSKEIADKVFNAVFTRLN